MGLFTNRKRNEDPSDWVKAADAIDALRPDWPGHPDDEALPPSDLEVAVDTFADLRLEDAGLQEVPESASPFDDEPALALDTVDDRAVPSLDTSEDEAAVALAEFGITLEETTPPMPPGPRRNPPEDSTTAQPGNVEIDVDGLLDVLGVHADASLVEISDARIRFLNDHDPSVETDVEAAKIKERIRREVNVAYASFRLSRVD